MKLPYTIFLLCLLFVPSCKKHKHNHYPYNYVKFSNPCDLLYDKSVKGGMNLEIKDIEELFVPSKELDGFSMLLVYHEKASQEGMELLVLFPAIHARVESAMSPYLIRNNIIDRASVGSTSKDIAVGDIKTSVLIKFSSERVVFLDVVPPVHEGKINRVEVNALLTSHKHIRP